jgi:hypothetical protein
MLYLYTVLLSIYEFHENRLQEGRTSVVGVNEMPFMGVNRDILERKHAC